MSFGSTVDPPPVELEDCPPNPLEEDAGVLLDTKRPVDDDAAGGSPLSLESHDTCPTTNPALASKTTATPNEDD